MPSDSSTDPFLKTINDMLSRAANQVGTMTILASVAAFGLARMFLEFPAAAGAACFVLGVVGLVEAFHVKRKAHLIERAKLSGVNAVFNGLFHARQDWNPMVLKQFTHGGFQFNAVGFKELPMALSVSKPACPACGSHNLLEIAECSFPGRITIDLRCACGYAASSKKTIAELMKEAAQLAGLPQ